MRSDAECRAAYLERQVQSLQSAPAVFAADRCDENRLIVLMEARYLGILRGAPAATPGPDESDTEARLRIAFWRPAAPDDVQPVQALLAIGVELLTEHGRPALMVLPGPYPPVAHPHVTPTLPGGVCLTDEWRIDRTDLGDVFRVLPMMLALEPGTYSTAQSRALAPGVTRWLREGAIERFELPLARPAPAGIRVLEAESDGR